ncbi:MULTISPECIES: hydrogenase formation protein HypD [Helicobacter]|uniref:Hydrogenase formation protein HypD n=1 Tax=Helicobacter ibis TaxID=2962633 RepID=A0ABT4VDE8_9HELI|nr:MULTISPECIES: hydrogenase formation protein HypD [Helicobacter]MDA3967829.1 hydrogenase formation protein HypD [Helicobacter sp. WB40]MDA3968731.1 hydrogenase formation protein HypD [Helicobacter ibis]
MNPYIDIYRDGEKIREVFLAINQISKKLKNPLKIMEVCGGHTHTIMKYSLLQLLPENIEFIHGPGCPVCVMPRGRIDHAYKIASQKDVILLTLGDMIKVPGSFGSLQVARSNGLDVRFIYSPLDILKIAKENKDKKIVYFAIGFETTTPMTAALLNRVIEEKLDNVFFHINHVLVPPPLEVILDSKDCKINALLAPSHVSVITGAKIYESLLDKYHLPIVVCGFEPLDIGESILSIVNQKINNESKINIQYARVVSKDGNLKAQELVDKYFTLRDSFYWRGLGEIPHSALRLKDEYAKYDAEIIFKDYLGGIPKDEHKGCICGEILRGNKKPLDCRLFAKACNPQNPLGSCMVSSEGACAAYYKYGGVSNILNQTK